MVILLASFAAVPAQTVDSKNPTSFQDPAKAANLDYSLKKAETPLLVPTETSPSVRRPSDSVRTASETKAVNSPSVNAATLEHLSIENAIDLLTKNNLSVIAARYNVDLAQAQKLVAALRPAATVTVSINQLTIPRLLKTPKEFYTTNGNAAANASYMVEYDRLIERGGKRNLRVSQAALNSQAAEALVTDALRQQIQQLKQSFLTALLARENLRVAIDSYRTFDASRTVIMAQVKEGYSAGVDLKRVELQKLQYQRDVSTAEQGLLQSLRDIYNLIGVGDTPSVIDDLKNVSYDDSSFVPQINWEMSILDGNLEIEPILLSVADLRNTALQKRPDIKNAELNLEAAKAGLKLASAQRQRDITLGGQFIRSGSDNTIGVVATFSLDVKRRADIAEAQAQVNIKLEESQLRLVQTQALTDVEKAFTAYMTSRSRLHLFTDQALVKAFDVRKIEEISYRDGAKGLIDYLDAQHIYNQTLLDYNQARYDYLLSLTQLEACTGTKLPGK